MTLKARIRSGEAFHLGFASLDLTGAALGERARQEGWDMVFVDLQHNPYTEPELVTYCRTAAEVDVPVMFRLPHPDTVWQIARMVDFGAAGVLVPMTETPEQVAEAVRNFYYPPVGGRSWGVRNAYGWKGGNDLHAYADWWRENGLLALQIETVEAVQRIRELIQPGIDLLLFGACDLGFSLDSTPDSPFASVADCQKYVVEQTRDFDVRVGVANMPFGRFDAVSN